jgi:hypothetical protein
MSSGSVKSRAFSPEHYDKEEHFVPMRDGVHLRTQVYTPRIGDGPWPVLLSRTPYNIDTRGFPCATAERTAEIAAAMHALAADGYVFVWQDIRGTGGSQGSFCLTALNPPGVTHLPDESTDAYDTVEWIVSSLPAHNGRVGVFGFSYGGFTTLAALINPHPALRAASPQAAMADMFRGDDFYMSGPLQLVQAIGLAVQLETGKAVDWPAEEAYKFFVDAGGVDAAAEKAGATGFPTWQQVRENSTRTAFWQCRELAPRLAECPIPCLHVVGWFDVEDFQGPLRVWGAMTQAEANHHHHLVIGPWRHGAWTFRGRGSNALGPIDFGEDTTHRYQTEWEAEFFHAWLKEGKAPELPRVCLYEVEGSGWRQPSAWPQKSLQVLQLHALADGSLVTEEPEEPSEITFHSDPARPVPYTRSPVGFYSGSGSAGADSEVKTRARALFAVEDQSFLEGRRDVVTWRTPPLAADFLLDGEPELIIRASTDLEDFDLVVHIFDERPRSGHTNYQLPVSRGALRASLRQNDARPERVPPGEPIDYRLPLQARLFRFRAGGRIGLRLMASWFPMLAVHPQCYCGTDPYRSSIRKAGRITVLLGGAPSTRLMLPTATS